MKNNFKKTVNHAKKFSLSSDEKAQIRSSLESHILENPPTGEILWQEVVERKHVLSFLKISDLQRFMVPAFALVMIVGVGVLASASQSALPGDVLYPVKILNEKVESGLSFNQSSIEKIDDKHAITRLEEAEMLEVQGKLDPEMKATLAESFQKSRRNTKESGDNFVKSLPKTLQSIAIVIDPSLSASTSPADLNQNNHETVKRRGDDYRVAKQKDKNVGTAATMAINAGATSTASTSASVHATSTEKSGKESSSNNSGNTDGSGSSASPASPVVAPTVPINIQSSVGGSGSVQVPAVTIPKL